MTQTMIAVENLGKHYRLGEIGGRTLREDVEKWLARLIDSRKLSTHTRIQQSGHKCEAGQIWAIRDINLEVGQGEILGIIGHNGAGKSTLLKILSSITAPTTGSVRLAGRVGSLLEVGTGFHPELTGRENIYLNGAILGMKRIEISKKLDEIIAFSEVEEFIDTPIKRYSSGMKVRLAFAVAAHLEPEILLVDEVLAVGDASFQKKCIGKMDEVSGSGKTIIFVSHNLSSIRRLCSRLVVLKKGELIHDGDVDAGIGLYLEEMRNENMDMPVQRDFTSDNGSYISLVKLITQRSSARLFHSDPLQFCIRFNTAQSYSDLELNISFWDQDVKLFMLFGSDLSGCGFNQTRSFSSGVHQIDFSLPTGLFWPGIYHINMTLHRPGDVLLHQAHPAFTFEILDNRKMMEKYSGLKKARINIEPVDAEYKLLTDNHYGNE